jgi:hypothetical protein
MSKIMSKIMSENSLKNVHGNVPKSSPVDDIINAVYCTFLAVHIFTA